VVGKNKQYTLNRDNIVVKYRLCIVEEMATVSFLAENFLIKKLVEHIGAIDLSTPIVLFGSHVKGYANQESDIDLLCVGELSAGQQEHFSKFENVYGKKVNLKIVGLEDFNSALRMGDYLIKEVVSKHIILCNADLFVSLLWRCYVERG
jgi:predicted nucleotidyltransferase